MRLSITVLLLAVVAVASAAAAAHNCPIAAAAAGIMKNDEAFIRAAFSKFQKDHGKLYAASENSEARYQVFRSNYLRALELNESLNEKHNTTGLKAHGVTQLMDLSPEELMRFTGYVRSELSNRSQYYDAPTGARAGGEPLESNWSKVKGVTTAVRNQGNCGGCWAFGTVVATESAAGVKYRNNTADSYLSVQQVIDCTEVCEGCGGGDPISGFIYAARFGGLIAEAEYPFTQEDGVCADVKHDTAVGLRGFEYALEPCERTGCDHQDEALASQKIAERGPVSACVHVSNDWLTYTGPDAFAGECESDWYASNHCLTVDGLVRDAQGELAWLVRNQWGTAWGAAGYILLPYGVNSCGVADEMAFALVD